MAKRGKRIDYERFCELVKQKTSADQICKALGIVSAATLKNLQRRMMLDTGQVWEIPGLEDRRRTRSIKFRPSMGLVISRATMAAAGFKPGDTFDVSFEGKKIVLIKK